MSQCQICSIPNIKIQREIEEELSRTQGTLSQQFLSKLKNEYGIVITQQDATVHFNFHQVISRSLVPSSSPSPPSLAEEINKDEASVLYEMLNSQMATFNVLSKKINGAFLDCDNGVEMPLVNRDTMELYKILADSIRENVSAISELNTALNGKKDGSLEGLKAVAIALSGSTATQDMTTKEYDD